MVEKKRFRRDALPEPWIRKIVRGLSQAAEGTGISICIYRSDRLHFSYSNCYEMGFVRICSEPPNETDMQIMNSIPYPPEFRKEVWVPEDRIGPIFQTYILAENKFHKWLRVYFPTSKKVSTKTSEEIGCVYFILNAARGIVKIGHSRNAKRRAMELRSHNLDDLIVLRVIETEYPQRLEKELHLRFKNYQKKGEWFIYDDEIKKYLESAEGRL